MDQNDYKKKVRFIPILIKKLRIVATIGRLAFNCRHSKEKNTSKLAVKELINATNICIRISQQQYFYQEVTALQKLSAIHKKSSLKSFNPFMDSDGRQN